MKKNYEKPELQIVAMETQSLIAATYGLSDKVSGDNEYVDDQYAKPNGGTDLWADEEE